ncbi:MAG: hypothetical protein D6772_00760 [Bacteroidetes bacterium]|nr:MAG: hypothetical protein D6772_00760 [Bacteroidota bacterium]
MDTFKKQLLDLLAEGKLLEVIKSLLESELPLPPKDKAYLLKLQQQATALPAVGEERDQLSRYLQELVERLFLEASNEPSVAPAPAVKPDLQTLDEAPPLARPKGGFMQRTWERLGELLSTGKRPSPTNSPNDTESNSRVARKTSSPLAQGGSPPKRSSPPASRSRGNPSPDKSASVPPGAPASVPEAKTNPFQAGKLLYVVPSRMPLHEISTCRIRIAPEHLQDAILKVKLNQNERAQAQTEAIRMTEVMRVELLNYPTDTDHFRISCRNNLEQPVFPFTVSEWIFDVVPQRPGKYALLIRVTAKINYAGAERSFDLVVLNRAVEVVTSGSEPVELIESIQPIPDNDWDETDELFVNQALQNNQIARAIERLANFVQDKDADLHIALLLQQARWNDNSNKLNLGLIATADWDLVNNQVRYAITQVHEQIKALDFSRDQSAALAEALKQLSNS